MGNADADGLDDIRAVARARVKAQRALDRELAREADAIRAKAAERAGERGIYSKLAKATGWSDEHVRKIARSHAPTPSAAPDA